MPGPRWLILSRVFCFFLLALIFNGCGAKAPIHLGFTAELSGKQADLSINLRNGVQMAVEEINAAGGIDGRKIELLVEDDLGTPDGAQKAENKLIDSGVVAVIGHLTSNQTVAGYEVAESRGVLLFSATASTSLMTGKKDLFFRTVASTEAMGATFASYIRQNRGLSRIAFIYDQDNNTYAEPLIAAFTDRLNRLGGEVTGQVKFSGAASPDFSPLVDSLKATHPEGLLIIASPANSAIIAQDIRLKDWAVALFGSSVGIGDALIQNGGDAVDGMDFILAFDINDPAPELQVFKEKYQKRFASSPTFIAMEGYETMRMLAAALQKTGGDAKGLPEALLELKDYIGLTVPIRLDEYGDAVRPLYILKVIDHKFITTQKVNPAE